MCSCISSRIRNTNNTALKMQAPYVTELRHLYQVCYSAKTFPEHTSILIKNKIKNKLMLFYTYPWYMHLSFLCIKYTYPLLRKLTPFRRKFNNQYTGNTQLNER